ncbi:MAG: hypothetical protein AAGF92_00165 [Myxococcota bacterium]
MRPKAWTTGPIAVLTVCLLSCGDSPPYSIAGSATLPACEESPAFDLTGTWFDVEGTVTVSTTGCDGAPAGAMFPSCSLDWEFEPTLDGSGAPIPGDFTILVDNEYLIEARLCGTTLYLEGGWWLPVAEPDGACLYSEDSAEEVGIQMEGSSLDVRREVFDFPDAEELLIAEGTLSVLGACAGTYEVVLDQFDTVVTPRSE